jgi:7,8-dihydroneopterin aldolase/epimerase/oxygenase
MSDRIFLHEMSFVGRHGVTDEERAEPQQIDVDVEVALDLAPAGRSDDLADTVDYGSMYELCREIVEQRSFRLLEGIAEAIAGQLLGRFERLESVTVRVRKPGLPIEGQLEHAGVTIERSRG